MTFPFHSPSFGHLNNFGSVQINSVEVKISPANVISHQFQMCMCVCVCARARTCVREREMLSIINFEY